MILAVPAESSLPTLRHLVVLLVFLGAGVAQAEGIRDRTRPETSNRDTTVSEKQAVELSLTLVQVAPQTLQTWIRTAATIDDTDKMLRATLCSPDSELVRLGQRVRAFSPESKSSIYQARITGISNSATAGDCLSVEANLAGPTYQQSVHYVMEIVVHRGEFLAIPSEAIIEEGDRQIAYVYKPGANSRVDADETAGRYTPREIHLGLQGELYTEVLDGLNEGERVVTLGSFFIDAEYQLKSTEQAIMSDAYDHH